jgi:hypothetical protein
MELRLACAGRVLRVGSGGSVDLALGPTPKRPRIQQVQPVESINVVVARGNPINAVAAAGHGPVLGLNVAMDDNAGAPINAVSAAGDAINGPVQAINLMGDNANAAVIDPSNGVTVPNSSTNGPMTAINLILAGGTSIDTINATAAAGTAGGPTTAINVVVADGNVALGLDTLPVNAQGSTTNAAVADAAPIAAVSVKGEEPANTAAADHGAISDGAIGAVAAEPSDDAISTFMVADAGDGAISAVAADAPAFTS